MTENFDFLSGYVIKSRIRLARNFSGLPFFIKNEQTANRITEKITLSLYKVDDFTLYKMSELSSVKKASMKELHLISSALVKNSKTGACLINKDQTVSIMIHEEDVVREQCILSGLRLYEAYKKLNVNEILIALSISAHTSATAAYVLKHLPLLAGCDIHSTVMLPSADMEVLKKLGLNVTCEPKYQIKEIFIS